MIKFETENYHDLIEELKPHLDDHYKEVAMYQDKIPLDPNYAAYGIAYDNGVLHMFTMRDEGELIGYNIFFVQTHPHYNSTFWATNDIVYIRPDHRHNLASLQFFRHCEEQLKDIGVQVITYHMKVMKTFQALMESLHMDHAEHMYTKYIG